jgi:hypothetical protein
MLASSVGVPASIVTGAIGADEHESASAAPSPAQATYEEDIELTEYVERQANATVS